MENNEILTELAVITELIEKNIKLKDVSLNINLNQNDFLLFFNEVQKQYLKKIDIPETSFNLKIGNVNIKFNKMII
jgi:hypothetical protein